MFLTLSPKDLRRLEELLGGKVRLWWDPTVIPLSHMETRNGSYSVDLLKSKVSGAPEGCWGHQPYPLPGYDQCHGSALMTFPPHRSGANNG